MHINFCSIKEYMKRIVFMVCLGIMSLVAYPQSKLLKGGNVSKVSASVTPKPVKKTPNYKKPVSTSRSVKKNPNAKYAASGYMEITGVSFANADYNGVIIDDYGADMYASEVRYLKPKLFYRGLSSEEEEITLYVKIIKEDGTIHSGTNSPEGYSYKRDITVKPGPGQSLILTGWGNKFATSYEPGLYAFELWYNGNKLFEKSIRLYSGSTPIATSKLITINDITFGSSDANNNMLVNFGDSLYEGGIMYLTPQISYKGLYSNNQNVTFFYRIFKADGSLSSGSSSPKGFTTNSSVTIKPGLNKVALAGWGNSKGTVYKAGIHTFELWLDGEKIYETTFNVGEKETDSYLTVDSKTRVSTTFSLNGGTETFYVKTVAGSWEIYDVPSWCNVTKKTETSFTLSCEPNKTGAARTGCIKVKAGDKEVRIDIEQTTYVGSDLFFT